MWQTDCDLHATAHACGDVGKGVIQLIMSLTIVLAGIVGIWVLIEIFTVKKDAKGLDFA